MFEVVRATLRTVSRSGHNHAESMCACPTALIRCADGTAGEASTPASSALAAAAVPPTSWRSIASSARSTARSSSQRRVPSTGSSSMSSPSTSRSMTSSHTVLSKTARSMRVSTYSGSAPAVSLSPIAVGRNSLWPRMIGLEAASTCSRTSSPPSAGSPIRTHWLRGLSPFTGVPSGR
ncbi:hypothetical protein [Nonomuraea rubra]|uniref:hypothetical protein n=1 Tax=Nonomuraea rubra TaxID=46180 RepID=UPI0031E621F6